MEREEEQKILTKFRDYVIKEAQNNISKLNLTYSGNLRASIKGEAKIMKNSLRLFFDMEEYGFFQDKGVKGANPSLVKNGIQKAPNSEFSFKIKKPPMQPLKMWAQKKNIRFRDSGGKYKKGNYDAIGFWLQKRIFAQGIKPSLFFTKPFNAAFKNLPDEMIQAYGLEAEETFDTIMKENFKK
jgi:hypothetical protein